MNRLLGICLILAASGLSACTVKAIGDPEKPITINAHIVIDIRELKGTATGIESMIQEGAMVNAATPTRLALLHTARKWLGPRIAYAAGEYDLKEITPQIEEALKRRKNRFFELQKMKSMEKLGENNEGYIKNFTSEEKLMRLANEENRDRKTIYDAIVTQNNLQPNSIYTVQSDFAEVQRKNTRVGEKIQLPNGEWITKS
jgi:uncharacterized protein YdbL (DUF1318 family)